MRFSTAKPDYDLTYDDVFMSPTRSSIRSRLDVDLSSTDGQRLPLPLVVANMTAISGRRMAETVARRGAVAVFPQDVPAPVVVRAIQRVKAAPVVFETPIYVTPETTAGEALALLPKRAHGAAVVVDEERAPLGIVTSADLQGIDRFVQVREAMVPLAELPTVSGEASPTEVFDLLASRRQKLALATDAEGRLFGVLTAKGAMRAALYSPAVDAEGRLRAGTAIGISGDAEARARTVLEAGSDVLVMDTAHGHQERMLAAVEKVRLVRDDYARQTGRHVLIVAGNVVTREGTTDLIDAGADIVKVGVGPGAMCTTRMQTGVGRPQFSAVLDCAETARDLGKSIWADGGVRHPRDVALALAGGAGAVMIGSWFAGTYESTGPLLTDAEGRAYKESFGMASSRAVRARTRQQALLERARASLFEEGISNSRMYLDPQRPGVEDLIDFIVSGVRSSCTYAGARTLEDFHARATIGVQSRSGYEEGRPLHVSW